MKFRRVQRQFSGKMWQKNSRLRRATFTNLSYNHPKLCVIGHQRPPLLQLVNTLVTADLDNNDIFYVTTCTYNVHTLYRYRLFSRFKYNDYL